MKIAIVDYGMGNLHSVLKSAQTAQKLADVNAEIVLTDFRDGQIGNITLELPTEWTKWLAAARIFEAQLREDRAQRQLDRKK